VLRVDVTVYMICPLVDLVSPVLCCVKPTCNSFTERTIKIECIGLVELFRSCDGEKQVGRCVGLSSDGDARRVRFQVADMVEKPIAGVLGPRFVAVEHESFTLSCANPTYPGFKTLKAHSQDPYQCAHLLQYSFVGMWLIICVTVFPTVCAATSRSL